MEEYLGLNLCAREECLTAGIVPCAAQGPRSVMTDLPLQGPEAIKQEFARSHFKGGHAPPQPVTSCDF